MHIWLHFSPRDKCDNGGQADSGIPEKGAENSVSGKWELGRLLGVDDIWIGSWSLIFYSCLLIFPDEFYSHLGAWKITKQGSFQEYMSGSIQRLILIEINHKNQNIQYLAQCLEYNQCSTNISWMNEVGLSRCRKILEIIMLALYIKHHKTKSRCVGGIYP